MRILLFGNRCRFTAPVMHALIDSGNAPVGIVIPSPLPDSPWLVLPTHAHPPTSGKPLPMADAGDEIDEVDRLASSAAVPVISVGALDAPETADAVATLAPDLIVSACFPRRISSNIVSVPRFGGINVHPSLLPRWRGPDPVFWTLHQGDTTSGVSIHRITYRFDSGPIVLQTAIPVLAGITYGELEQQLAELGGGLLVGSLANLGHAIESATQQPKISVTRAPLPRNGDFRAEPHWPVDRAYRFLAGVASPDCPVTAISTSGMECQVTGSVRPPGSSEIDEASGDYLEFSFADGTLTARVPACD